MGLVHWWPLNGNLYDLVSGNHLTYINNSSKLVVNNSGKLGKCYERTAVGTADLLRSTERMKVFEEESICAWVYISQHAALETANGVVTNHDHNTKSGLGIGVYPADATNYYVSINVGNGSDRVHSTYWGNTNIKGAWHHVCLVSDGSKIRMYVDGKEDRTAVNYSMYSKADYLDIFNWSTGYYDRTNYRPACKVCDVRVYDHALSTREVKDLAKGLMVHYGLEDPYIESTTNIDSCKNAMNTKTLTGFSAGGCSTVTFGRYYGYDCFEVYINKSSITAWTGVYLNINPTSYGAAVGDTVIRSCWMYVPPGQTAPVHFTESIEGSSTNKQFKQYDLTKCGTWQRVWLKGTLAATSGNNYLHYFMAQSTGSVNFKCYIRDFQMEIKDHVTPFTLGTRVGEVIDNSGNGYNGTPLDIVMSEDSGRGQYAAVFNGNTSYIETPFIKSDLVTSDWTLGFWYYNNDGNGSAQVNRAVIIGDHQLETSTFNVEKYQNGYLRTYLNGGGSDVVHSTDNAANDPFLIPAQQWCHIMLTYSGGVLKTYLNGVFKSSITYTITSVKTRGLRIGRDNRSGETAFNGKIADFKMYATALSADEVAYEAKKAKRFFRSGKIKVRGLYEQTEDKACVNSSILQKCARIVEISDGFGVTGEATVDIARDKSYWLQVMHHNNYKGTNMFSSSDKSAMPNKLIYKNDDCWCAFHLITNYGDLGDGYEFLAMDDFWNGQHHVQRWKQNTNPVVSSATPTILSGSCSFGGLRLNNSQAFMSRPSNWWAACGCWTVHSTTADRNITGVPGFTDTSHDCEESMDLFVRVKEDKLPDLLYKEFKGGVVELYEIDEI